MGPCLSPHVADHPLRSATDHRLGRPLPHQQANRTQAPRSATPKGLSFTTPLGSEAHAELPPVSGSYPPPNGRLPTWSSPVRHGRAPKDPSFDLHALGTPPALILSQDQTLHHCRQGFPLVRHASIPGPCPVSDIIARLPDGSPSGPASSSTPARPRLRSRSGAPFFKVRHPLRA